MLPQAAQQLRPTGTVRAAPPFVGPSAAVASDQDRSMASTPADRVHVGPAEPQQLAPPGPGGEAKVHERADTGVGVGIGSLPQPLPLIRGQEAGR